MLIPREGQNQKLWGNPRQDLMASRSKYEILCSFCRIFEGKKNGFLCFRRDKAKMFWTLKEGIMRNIYRSACRNYGARWAQSPTVSVLCYAHSQSSSGKAWIQPQDTATPSPPSMGRQAGGEQQGPSCTWPVIQEMNLSDNKRTLAGIISRNRKAAVSQLSNKKATALPRVVVLCCSISALGAAPAAAVSPGLQPPVHTSDTSGRTGNKNWKMQDIWSKLTKSTVIIVTLFHHYWLKVNQV